MKDKNTELYKVKLLTELSLHIGEANAIGMGELYSVVFEKDWDHKINDTRKLRSLITKLRREGVPIGSVSDRDGGGYYLPAAGSELADYCSRIHRRALKALSMESKIRKISLAELLGQMRLNLEGGDEDEAA